MTTNAKRFGNRWTVNEILSLQREYELLGWSLDQIAEKHGRTVNAIMFKLDQENLADYNVLYGDYHSNGTANIDVKGAEDNSDEEEEEEDNDEDYVDNADDENEDEDDDDEDDDEIANLSERVTNIESSIDEIKNMLKQILQKPTTKSSRAPESNRALFPVPC